MHLKSNGDYIIKSEMIFAEAPPQKNCLSGNPTDSRKKTQILQNCIEFNLNKRVTKNINFFVAKSPIKRQTPRQTDTQLAS